MKPTLHPDDSQQYWALVSRLERLERSVGAIYDSGWLADNNGTGGLRTYTHGLGLASPPRFFRLWFSPDQVLWYPVAENRGTGTNEMSAGTAANYHNPSVVRVQANTVEIGVYSPVAGGGSGSMPLFSGYTGSVWLNYASGYWRYTISA